ncbi:uncharacterized protein YALI1_A21012g [Yarrowia lipolytica]|uniref:Uncharacterized protein n=1 Tax=Yarrowia lipolytica TaxID=4952 RepID=A0A1D8N5K0_YARLL|nr:hypothetical protein YALI1_A21012g [Yarrowia lipolytica]
MYSEHIPDHTGSFQTRPRQHMELCHLLECQCILLITSRPSDHGESVVNTVQQVFTLSHARYFPISRTRA